MSIIQELKSVIEGDDWEQFELLLKQHDWSHEMSDDARYWRSGQASWKEIEKLGMKLSQEDPKRVMVLYNKYAPNKSRENFFLAKYQKDQQYAKYLKSIEDALTQAIGEAGGTVKKSGTYQIDIRLPPTYYKTFMVGQKELTVSISGTFKGASLTIEGKGIRREYVLYENEYYGKTMNLQPMKVKQGVLDLIQRVV